MDDVHPVRLLTITTLYPSLARPRHGIFVSNRLRRLCATGRVEASVIAPVPWFPGWYRQEAQAAASESVDGIEVRHPRFLNIPRVGLRLQPRLIAAAVLRDLEASGWRRRSFDLIDAHYLYPDAVAAAHVARALGLPLVASARGSDVNLLGTMAWPRACIVKTANRAAAVIAVSNALASAMKSLGVADDRIVVLRNGVDAQLFRPEARDESRARLGLATDARVVVAVGNLVTEKGLDLLLNAVAPLADVQVLLVGEGPCARTLDALAARRLPGRLRRLATMPQSELRYVYSAADVLALPSLREGWPNVLLEALACGTPVVAAAVGGVPEIVCGPIAGTLVTTRSEAVWTDAIAAALRDRPPALDVRAAALAFAWDDVIARQCELYEQVSADHVATEW